MANTFEVIYENGVLKPSVPLPLKEHERVQISIQTQTNWVRETQGMLGWAGDHATLERVALDPQLDLQEGP